MTRPVMNTFVLFALLAALAISAQGATIQNDQNLPGGTGFYNGSGNVDGHFTTSTVDMGNGVTLMTALRLAWRYNGPITPNGGSNDYTCLPAQQCNVEFSLFLVGATLDQLTDTQIAISDVTTGGFFTINPLTTIPDNAYWHPTLGEQAVQNLATQVGFQNSEYLGFSFISNDLGGWNSTDKLDVRFKASLNEGPLADARMTVNGGSSVPEPGTYAMMGAGLLALALGGRRRRKS